MASKTSSKKTGNGADSLAVKKTSRTARKTTFKTSASVIEHDAGVAPETTGAIGGKSIKIHKSTIVIAVVIVLLGVLVLFAPGIFVAAMVNGQPIARLQLVQDSEKQSGKQVMATLIRNVLIEQEASRLNVSISDKEINDEIKKIEEGFSKQGQKIDQMLAMEGLTRNDLKGIIRVQLLVGKIVGKNIKITDKEVNEYIEKNKDILPKDLKESELKKTVKERLTQQQLPEKAQAWLVEVEKKASIKKFVNY